MTRLVTQDKNKNAWSACKAVKNLEIKKTEIIDKKKFGETSAAFGIIKSSKFALHTKSTIVKSTNYDFAPKHQKKKKKKNCLIPVKSSWNLEINIESKKTKITDTKNIVKAWL